MLFFFFHNHDVPRETRQSGVVINEFEMERCIAKSDS